MKMGNIELHQLMNQSSTIHQTLMPGHTMTQMKVVFAFRKLVVSLKEATYKQGSKYKDKVKTHFLFLKMKHKQKHHEGVGTRAPPLRKLGIPRGQLWVRSEM